MTRYFVYGVVQGVGFRPTVYNIAVREKVRGFVRNNGSNVEICVDDCGFMEKLKNALPPLARIDRIVENDDSDVDYSLFSNFKILESSQGSPGSLIPVDTAMCEKCKEELFDVNSRRYLYPFTNCTDCGARYSAIWELPYDRKMTSMRDFPRCSDCEKEYSSPGNRRMHAQTISCPSCGPQYKLYSSENVTVKCENPIKRAVELIENGKIVAVKSWGGTHIFSSLENAGRIRNLYRRGNKPFAVMMRDIETAEKYTYISDEERKLLQSPSRPIVILKKLGDIEEDNISPHLDNIGVMLPYSPMHHIMFHYYSGDGFVATSGNPPGKPMAITDAEAFKLPVDYFLLHNRKIIQRVDDSVVKCYGDKHLFIRKSRGYVPLAISGIHKYSGIGVGAELNVNIALSSSGRLYVSQYIGDTEEYDTLNFGMSTFEHLAGLLGIKELDFVARDMHPLYDTRKMSDVIASEYSAELFDIQHHWAHSRALSFEYNTDDIVAITVDGAGYGTDDTIWGGEILVSHREEFERPVSLGLIPLVGGDMAVKDPARILAGIAALNDSPLTGYFDENTEEIMRKAAFKSPVTSSLGRVLDAVSYSLGICRERTYDGEPAIRLEPYLGMGKDLGIFEFGISGSNRRIDNLSQFKKLMETNLKKYRKEDIAVSFVKPLIEKMADKAVDLADEHKIKSIGITGGVSYSLPILKWAEESVAKYGYKLLIHNTFPAGDGGISTGQNIAGGELFGNYQ